MQLSQVKDYRDFLKAHAEVKQLTNPRWNFSIWARTLGLSSTSSLTKVLNGERKPGPKMVDQFVRYFKFTKEEEAHFRGLILLSKDKQASFIRSLLGAETRKESSLQKRVLQLFEFRLIAEWQHLSIRELFRVKHLPLTASKIKSLLKDELDLPTIEKSIALLKTLKLIRQSANGEWVSTDEQIHTENEIPDSAIRFYHEQKLDQAKRRIVDTPTELREFQSLTFLLNRAELPAIKSKIRKFMEEIEGEVSSEQVDQLYQFQVQLFPVTEPFSKKHTLHETENTKTKKEETHE